MDELELLQRLKSIGEERLRILCDRTVPTQYLPGLGAPFATRVHDLVTMVVQDPPWRAAFENDLRGLSPVEDSTPEERWINWEARRRHAMFREDLFGREPVVPSPLRGMWHRFTIAPAWQTILCNLLTEIENALENYYAGHFVNAIVTLKGRLNVEPCTVLHEQARQLHKWLQQKIVWPPLNDIDKDSRRKQAEQRQQLSSALEGLRRFVSRQAFGRCFLIVGGVGSGKTHSIATFLDPGQSPSSERRVFMLPLRRPEGYQSLEQSVNGQLQTVTGVSAVNLNSLDAVIARRSDGTAARIVLAIDNVDQWIDWGFDEALRELVERTSSRGVIYWVVTVLETRYHAVKGTRLGKLLESMGFGPEAIAQLMPRETMRENEGTTSASGHTIGEWLFLDAFNRTQEVGLGILKSSFEPVTGATNELQPQQSYTAAPKNELNEAVTLPLIAWIVRDLSQGSNLRDVVRLQHIELLRRFWSARQTSLMLPVGATLEQLQQVIALVARCIVWARRAPTIPKLLDLANTGVGEAWIKQPENVEKALQALERSGLLAVRIETASINGDVIRSLEPRVDLFWQWRIAMRLLEKSEIKRAGVEGLAYLLQKHILPLEDRLRDGVVQFLLLLVDASPPDALETREVFRRTLQIQGAEPAAWFAGPWASSIIQRDLARIALSAEEAINQHLLFAHLYFFAGADDRAVSVVNRFRSLATHVVAIQAAGLSEYFLYLAVRHLGAITEVSVLLQCLEHLFEVGALDVCDKVAAKASEMMFQLTPGSSAAAKEVVHYARMSPRRRSENPARSTDSNIARSSRTFREWFLCHAARHIVDAMRPVDAYALMHSVGWMGAEEWWHNFHLRKEAANALGRWYRSRFSEPGAIEFIDLITALTDSSQVDDIEFAFYALAHGLRSHTDRGLPGDPRLRPLIARTARVIVEMRKDYIINSSHWKMVQLNAPYD